MLDNQQISHYKSDHCHKGKNQEIAQLGLLTSGRGALESKDFL